MPLALLSFLSLPGSGCPLPRGIQGQAGWGCEQPGLVGGVPACSRGVELDDPWGPFQPKPFYGSVILKQSYFGKFMPASPRRGSECAVSSHHLGSLQLAISQGKCICILPEWKSIEGERTVGLTWYTTQNNAIISALTF